LSCHAEGFLRRLFVLGAMAVWSQLAPQTESDKGSTAESNAKGDYVYQSPAGTRKMSEHFSNLFLSGDATTTVMELLLLCLLTLASVALPSEKVNVPGSMPLWEVACFFWATTIVTRLYNSYLEACYFAFPQHRTQPPNEHALKLKKDLCGRDARQLESLIWHDRGTLISQFVFGVLIYYLVPGYYPPMQAVVDGGLTRVLKLAGNHYIMAFGMYWGHRAYHVNPFLWKNLHSIHHWARHPLSRNTYQDHWLENLINHIGGHFSAQILLPLDHGTFWFSHIFRIFESLEKHSGISCYLNLAHQTQRWLPFAQMPHHHDWHHEGHKGSNFTFSSIGGLWDCVFGTRKAGRANFSQSTARDRAEKESKDVKHQKLIMDDPTLVLVPWVLFLLTVTWKLKQIVEGA